MNFKDKVVIVTGASGGIGAAIAIAFVKNNANVTIVGRNEEKLRKVSKLCEGNGNTPLVIQADITKDDEAKKVIDKTIICFGKIDVLINNAGILAKVSIESTNALQVFDDLMNTNIRAVVVLCNLAVKYLTVTKGNIINISSVSSMCTLENFWAYSASKAGLDHLSRGLAIDLAGKGIRVNTVNPGPVRTDIFDSMITNEPSQKLSFDTLKAMTALNMISEPEEIAQLVLFLASEKAKSVTGSSYVIDCGVLLK